MLQNYLKVKTAEKALLSVAELKRQFPKEKEDIKTYLFVGLLEPVSQERPDTVRAYIY